MKTKSACISIALGLNLVMGNVSAEESTYLQVKPKKCVALRKGQICYQRLKVSFATPVAGDYCVYLSGGDKPIKCWTNVSKGSVSYEFSAPESVDFTLQALSGKLLASSKFTVAWVYSSNRTRRRNAWRLF